MNSIASTDSLPEEEEPADDGDGNGNGSEEDEGSSDNRKADEVNY
jgi:hypothetical protein